MTYRELYWFIHKNAITDSDLVFVTEDIVPQYVRVKNCCQICEELCEKHGRVPECTLADGDKKPENATCLDETIFLDMEVQKLDE